MIINSIEDDIEYRLKEKRKELEALNQLKDELPSVIKFILKIEIDLLESLLLRARTQCPIL